MSRTGIGMMVREANPCSRTQIGDDLLALGTVTMHEAHLVACETYRSRSDVVGSVGQVHVHVAHDTATVVEGYRAKVGGPPPVVHDLVAALEAVEIPDDPLHRRQ
eukprot:CAMPEP_0115884096 /NCGR_PEP_ID=MMETSP0287-20121206/29934_1 /TAXON_ID=412157 /ORGANISM="Chrysochromulina rotalis, Strain UIO044" /LENGTH=104 /DNA_ID=CAMNT_0003340375 /DNA_START=53 /DNA_END=367 /DNA_ORIENTATION=+